MPKQTRRLAIPTGRIIGAADWRWRRCWRGGQRSGSLAWFLDQIGFRTAKLAGGYKGFRAVVLQDLAAWPARFDFRVLAGRTGSAFAAEMTRTHATVTTTSTTPPGAAPTPALGATAPSAGGCR